MTPLFGGRRCDTSSGAGERRGLTCLPCSSIADVRRSSLCSCTSSRERDSRHSLPRRSSPRGRPECRQDVVADGPGAFRADPTFLDRLRGHRVLDVARPIQQFVALLPHAETGSETARAHGISWMAGWPSLGRRERLDEMCAWTRRLFASAPAPIRSVARKSDPPSSRGGRGPGPPPERFRRARRRRRRRSAGRRE